MFEKLARYELWRWGKWAGCFQTFIVSLSWTQVQHRQISQRLCRSGLLMRTQGLISSGPLPFVGYSSAKLYWHRDNDVNVFNEGLIWVKPKHRAPCGKFLFSKLFLVLKVTLIGIARSVVTIFCLNCDQLASYFLHGNLMGYLVFMCLVKAQNFLVGWGWAGVLFVIRASHVSPVLLS